MPLYTPPSQVTNAGIASQATSAAPATPNTSGIPNFNGNASDELGWLYNQQWQQYLQQYAPQENLQLGLISDAGNALERQQATAAAAAPYANGKPLADLKRNALSFGQTLSPTQIQSFKQKSNLQSGTDQVNAYNQTTTQQVDRGFGVIGSGPPQTGASYQNPAQLVQGS